MYTHDNTGGGGREVGQRCTGEQQARKDASTCSGALLRWMGDRTQRDEYLYDRAAPCLESAKTHGTQTT
eukprot:9742762-Prorocentrum_lima.AAC.1